MSTKFTSALNFIFFIPGHFHIHLLKEHPFNCKRSMCKCAFLKYTKQLFLHILPRPEFAAIWAFGITLTVLIKLPKICTTRSEDQGHDQKIGDIQNIHG